MRLEIKLNQEQFDLLLNSLVQVAQGVHRLADSWEGKGKETEILGDIFVEELGEGQEKTEKPKRHYTPRSAGDIGARTVMKRNGLRYNSHLFLAACDRAKVKPFKHGGDHHLFIKQIEEKRVVSELNRLTK